jgi:hypothetical protein
MTASNTGLGLEITSKVNFSPAEWLWRCVGVIQSVWARFGDDWGPNKGENGVKRYEKGCFGCWERSERTLKKNGVLNEPFS